MNRYGNLVFLYGPLVATVVLFGGGYFIAKIDDFQIRTYVSFGFAIIGFSFGAALAHRGFSKSKEGGHRSLWSTPEWVFGISWSTVFLIFSIVMIRILQNVQTS